MIKTNIAAGRRHSMASGLCNVTASRLRFAILWDQKVLYCSETCSITSDTDIHDRLAGDMTDGGQTAEAADSALTLCQLLHLLML